MHWILKNKLFYKLYTRCVIHWDPWEADSESEVSSKVFYAEVPLELRAVEERRKKQANMSELREKSNFEVDLSRISAHLMGDSEIRLILQNCPHGIKRLGLYTPSPHVKKSLDPGCWRGGTLNRQQKQ